MRYALVLRRPLLAAVFQAVGEAIHIARLCLFQRRFQASGHLSRRRSVVGRKDLLPRDLVDQMRIRIVLHLKPHRARRKPDQVRPRPASSSHRVGAALRLAHPVIDA